MVLALISGTLFAGGFVFTGFYVWSSSGPHLRFLGIGMLTACAAFAVGCLAGLIVGIPRFVSSGQMRHDIETRRMQAAASPPAAPQVNDPADTTQAATVPSPVRPTPPGVLVARGAPGAQDQPGQQAQPGDAGAPPDDGGATQDQTQNPAPASQLTPSTNLAEISDWLTKLLLGAGLVELTRLGHPLSQLVDTVARSIQNVAPGAKLPQGSAVVAGGLLALYVVLGFLVSYIITTLWYGRYLERFD
jgi:hypothetical protein